MTTKLIDYSWTKTDNARHLTAIGTSNERYMRNYRDHMQWVPADTPVIEGARLVVNQVAFSDPTVAQLSTGTSVTNASTPIYLEGYNFDNSIFIDDSSTLRNAYSNGDPAVMREGRVYTSSFFIEMSDGSRPEPGNTTNVGDFCVVVGGTIATRIGMEQMSETVWRVWGVRAEDSTPNAGTGVIKYTSQSDNTFKVTGFMLEDTTYKWPYYRPSEYVHCGGTRNQYRYFFNAPRTNFALGSNDLHNLGVKEDFGQWDPSSWATVNLPTAPEEGFPNIVPGMNWYHLAEDDTASVQHNLRFNVNFGYLITTNAFNVEDYVAGSLYIAAGDRTDVMFQTITNGNHQRAFVDLTDGSTYNVSASYNTISVTDTGYVAPNGNTIWRIWMRWKDNDRGFVPYWDIAVHDGVSASGIYNGDGTSGIYIAGIQWEQADNPTAFIANNDVNTGREVYDAPLPDEPEGLRTTNAKTNLITEVWDFDTTWAESGAETVVTVNTNASSDPFGGFKATVLGDDGGGGTASIGIQHAVTLATSTEYMYGFFARKYSETWVYGSISALGALDITQYFDLQNGVIGTSGANINRVGMIPFKDVWYFCWFTFTSDAVDTSGTANIFVADGDLDTTINRDGLGRIFIYGPQLQAGGQPWNWVYTDGGSASIPAQSFERPMSPGEVAALSDGDTGWSAYSRGERHERSLDTVNRIWTFGSSSDEVFLSLRDDGPDNLTAQTRVGAVLSGSSVIAGALSTTDMDWEHATRVQTNDFFCSAEGNDALVDTSTDIPDFTGLDLHIGQRDGGAQILDGWHKDFRVWDGPLDDTTVTGLGNGTVDSTQSHFDVGDDEVFKRKRQRDQFRRRYRRT